jgi:peptidoglycan/LPS O-acetylase OafA/YrhL
MLGIGGGPYVNGYKTVPLLGGTWTLSYEWRFYFSLIIIAFAARDNRTHLPIAAVGLTVSLSYLLFINPDSTCASCTALLSVGMLCASLERGGLTPVLPDVIASGVILGLLAVVMLTSSRVYAAGPTILLGAHSF